MTVSIEPVPVEMLGLVDRFYKRCGEKARCGRRDQVYVMRDESEIVAAARLLAVDGCWLLRNLTVAPDRRRRGLARQLMQTLLERHKDRPMCCYALAELEDFYRSLGFVRSVVERLSPAIGQTFERYRVRGKPFVLMACFPVDNNGV